MSARAYTPGASNSPFGNSNQNPLSSQYGQDSGYSPDESILLERAIKKVIFDAAPKQYNALKLLFEKSAVDMNNDEFEYLEYTFGRSPISATAGVGAQAASAGNSVTQTIPISAASVNRVSPDLIIVYPDNTKAVITSVGPGNQIIVESLTSVGLPAITNGDVFSIQSTIAADAQDYFSNYERVETVTRYNYIQLFTRARRWGKIEMQKHKNSGTTNYLDIDKEQQIKQLRIDMFNSFFNGNRGEFRITNQIPAKSMGGIYPSMVTAGSANSNPTVAGLITAFEALAFQTNYKAEGGVRFVYGTDEILHELKKAHKLPGLRYAPNDRVADLNLTKIEFGTMEFVLVPCELFKETSCFPAAWNRRMLVLDQETISPVKMRGLPMIDAGDTLDRGTNGTREMFKDWWVWGQLSIMFNNPLASYWLDVQ